MAFLDWTHPQDYGDDIGEQALRDTLDVWSGENQARPFKTPSGQPD